MGTGRCCPPEAEESRVFCEPQCIYVTGCDSVSFSLLVAGVQRKQWMNQIYKKWLFPVEQRTYAIHSAPHLFFLLPWPQRLNRKNKTTKVLMLKAVVLLCPHPQMMNRHQWYSSHWWRCNKDIKRLKNECMRGRKEERIKEIKKASNLGLKPLHFRDFPVYHWEKLSWWAKLKIWMKLFANSFEKGLCNIVAASPPPVNLVARYVIDSKMSIKKLSLKEWEIVRFGTLRFF